MIKDAEEYLKEATKDNKEVNIPQIMEDYKNKCLTIAYANGVKDGNQGFNMTIGNKIPVGFPGELKYTSFECLSEEGKCKDQCKHCKRQTE